MPKYKEITREERTPEQTYKTYTDKRKTAIGKLAELDGCIRDLEENIVDSDNGERKALEIQLRELRGDRETLMGEIRILLERRKTSFLTIYALELEKAMSESSEIRGRIDANKVELEKAEEKKWHFKRTGEDDRERQMEIEMEFARCRAFMLVDQQALQRAKGKIYAAEANLQSAKTEILKWE